MVDELVDEVLAGCGSVVWTRTDEAGSPDDVELDITLRSLDPQIAPDVRIVQSNSDQNIQLAIGNSSFELWWRGPEDAVHRVRELRGVLSAISAGGYHERSVEHPGRRVVYGEIRLPGKLLTMETISPR